MRRNLPSSEVTWVSGSNGVMRGVLARLDGNRHRNDRPASRVVAQHQRAAESIDTLADAAETEMAAAVIDVGHRQPTAVVPDHELHPCISEAELDVDACRLRVLDAVGQRLETN